MGEACRERRRLRGQSRPLYLESLEERLILSNSSGVGIPQFLLFHDHGALPDGSPTPPSGALQPYQMVKAYGINQIMFGNVAGNGAGQTIAIVDAYDDPKIAADLATFDTTAVLPW